MADEFRVPVTRFVLTLKGTPDEVWTRVVLNQFKQQSKTNAEWRDVMTQLKGG